MSLTETQLKALRTSRDVAGFAAGAAISATIFGSPLAGIAIAGGGLLAKKLTTNETAWWKKTLAAVGTWFVLSLGGLMTYLVVSPSLAAKKDVQAARGQLVEERLS